VYLDHGRDIGSYNPCFPEYEIRVEGDKAWGTVSFPVAYEGPPGCVHGGFLAVFFDCVIQHHNCDYGVAGNFGSVTPRQTNGAGEPWREGRMVRQRPLDALDLPDCGMLKVDVEGWEVGVLRGGMATIARCRPILYVENDRAAHQAELIALIDALGYVQYWHIAPLFSPTNFNEVGDDIFNAVSSMNMLCVPAERNLTVTDMERIDPQNWRSPLTPIGG